MEAKLNPTIVGAFVLVLSGALIAGVLWLSSGRPYRKAFDLYETYLTESVSGLNVNAPVRYRGVEVGRVRNIVLAPNNVEQVQLTLAIERGTPIKEDTVSVLRTQGLTGIAYVDLSGGSQDSPRLRALPGQALPVIRAAPSLMVRLDTAVTALLDNLNRTSENFNALIDKDSRHALRQVLTDLGLLTQALARRSATIEATIENSARMMENAARLTAELSRLAQRIGQSADRFDRMSSEVAKTTQDISRMADEIERVGTATNTLIESTRTEARQVTGVIVPEVAALVGELRELTGLLRRFSMELERDPSMLIHGRPPARRGPGE